VGRHAIEGRIGLLTSYAEAKKMRSIPVAASGPAEETLLLLPPYIRETFLL